MKLQQLSFVAAIASVTFSMGCATSGKTSKAPTVAMPETADAFIYINGLS